MIRPVRAKHVRVVALVRHASPWRDEAWHPACHTHPAPPKIRYQPTPNTAASTMRWLTNPGQTDLNFR